MKMEHLKLELYTQALVWREGKSKNLEKAEIRLRVAESFGWEKGDEVVFLARRTVGQTPSKCSET